MTTTAVTDLDERIVAARVKDALASTPEARRDATALAELLVLHYGIRKPTSSTRTRRPTFDEVSGVGMIIVKRTISGDLIDAKRVAIDLYAAGYRLAGEPPQSDVLDRALLCLQDSALDKSGKYATDAIDRLIDHLLARRVTNTAYQSLCLFIPRVQREYREALCLVVQGKPSGRPALLCLTYLLDQITNSAVNGKKEHA